MPRDRRPSFATRHPTAVLVVAFGFLAFSGAMLFMGQYGPAAANCGIAGFLALTKNPTFHIRALNVRDRVAMVLLTVGAAGFVAAFVTALILTARD